jgi:DNA-binding MarR family transcriptional regulator
VSTSPNPAEQERLRQSRVLSGKLFQVAERARADFEAIAEQHDLTALQARTLLWLERPSSMRELARHLTCDASSVTGLADRLERRGVVERTTGDDRRVTLLQLTPEGRRLRRRLARQVSNGSTVVARLDADQRRTLGALLDELLS